MEEVTKTLVILFVTCVLVTGCPTDDATRVCQKKEKMTQVRMQDDCSKEIFVNSSIEVSPTGQPFSVLKNCLNCSLTLRASDDRRLAASLYSLATETGPNRTCDLNRLDIFDGELPSEENRLTDDSGICGCELHKYSGFLSTNNTMTLVFNTKCDVPVQHGEFRLIVTSVNNDTNDEEKHCAGYFECTDGSCIDKNLVCDGQANCKDQSDEKGCKIRNGSCDGMFECENEQCIDKNLVCDGEFNCEDHSDEINCTRTVNGTCPGLFECKSNRKCIDKNLVCDGVNNCGDSSDEKGCSFFRRLSKLLLLILLLIACLCLVFLIVILIILCWRYCTKSGKIASTYRRLT